nr:hypothetical protein [Calditrichia bacterium]
EVVSKGRHGCVGGFKIFGTSEKLDDAWVINIFSLTADEKGKSPISQLLQALEEEALANGASKVRIYGHAIIEQRLINAKGARRFGYVMRKINADLIELEKVIY